MITAAVITMTFLGCGDETVDCEFISQAPKTYTSQMVCEAAIPAMLLKMSDAPYAVVTGHCGPENDLASRSTPVPVSPSIAANNHIPEAAGQIETKPPLIGTDDDVANGKKPLKRVFKRIENGFAYVRSGTSTALTNLGERTRNGLANLAARLKLLRQQLSN
jgi:hypothetical protein